MIKASDTAPGAGTIAFAYDILDRLIQETTPHGTVAYQYDVLGRRTQMAANGQQPAIYQYDAASRLTRVEQGTLFATLGYDNANRRTSLGYSNGTSTSYAYDLASRLTNITHHGPGSSVIEAVTYSYDAAGNRLSLTRANGTASLVPNAVSSAIYDAANEQTAFAGATLTYDDNGNLTNDGTNTYQWDARNRTSGSFSYDALGRRTSKAIGSVTSQFLYDGNDIAAEISGGLVGVNYLRSLNIDEPFIRQAGPGNEHYHTDALGSSLALSNTQSSASTTYTYEPFGKTTQTGAVSTSTFKFTGREEDASGLYYYRARYYQPRLQRFIAEDSIGYLGGDVNLYGYVGQNPILRTDPSGQIPLGPGVILGCGLGAMSGYIGAKKPVQGAIVGGLVGCSLGPLIAGIPRGIPGLLVGAYVGGLAGSVSAGAAGGDMRLGTVAGVIGGGLGGLIGGGSGALIGTGLGIAINTLGSPAVGR